MGPCCLKGAWLSGALELDRRLLSKREPREGVHRRSQTKAQQVLVSDVPNNVWLVTMKAFVTLIMCGENLMYPYPTDETNASVPILHVWEGNTFLFVSAFFWTKSDIEYCASQHWHWHWVSFQPCLFVFSLPQNLTLNIKLAVSLFWSVSCLSTQWANEQATL